MWQQAAVRRFIFFLVILPIAFSGRGRAEEPPLSTVLQRAAAYVADFNRRVAGVVAEETYVQDVEYATTGARPSGVSHRELKSDFLLVQIPGEYHFVEFRDVFEVDGRPVRDRQDRLTRLFLDPASRAQARSIVEESARYNIGRVERTVNTPMLPLLFLEQDVQPRFEFKRSANAQPATSRLVDSAAGVFTTSAEVWTIEYQEKAAGTVVRTLKGKDLPTHGRFWIDPETGRVLMSELLTHDDSVTATIDVSYQSEPLPGLAGLSVPAEMRERYAVGAFYVTGTAAYGRFRQFSVSTNENIGQPSR